MKVFFALLAFAPVVNAVELPSLRGFAVSLTDEQTTAQAQDIFELTPGRYGASCRSSGDTCSTNENAQVTKKCCNTPSITLTCVRDDSSTNPIYDGVCEEPPTVTNEEESFRGPVGLGGPPCRKIDDHCSTSTTVPYALQCCNAGDRGTTGQLRCNPSTEPSVSFYNGVCVADGSDA